MIILDLLCTSLFGNKFPVKWGWALSQVEQSTFTFAKNLPTQVLFLELELKIETLVTKLKLVVT